MNIDQNMLFSYATFNPCCTKRQKNCIFCYEFYKNFSNSQFLENADEKFIYV